VGGDGYNLAVASLLLFGVRLGDRAGHKRSYLAGLLVFGLGSGLCALAPAAGWLIGFRAIQGIGAAIELPATLAILTHTFTGTRERAQAVGIWTAAAGTSLVLGPVLGGALTTAFGWPAVFVLNLPIALTAIVLTLAAVRERGEPDTGGIDLPGQILGAATLALLAGGAIEGGDHGFAGPLPLGLFVAGIACLAGFLAVERHRAHPLLPLGFFRRPTYAAANGDALVMGFVTVGVLFCFALFFQQARGDSALVAGVKFVPLTIVFVLVGPLVGRVIDQVGHRVPMAAGSGLMGLAVLLLLRVGASGGYGAVAWPFAVLGLGYGLLSTPMAAAVLSTVPAHRAGMASATNLSGRLVGGVFGIAVVGAFLPGGTPQDGQAFTAGLHTALVVAAVVAFAGAAAAAIFISTHATGSRPSDTEPDTAEHRGGAVEQR
jgi:DHA2 family methylenomycin A resistance protein-like MFS transporter